MELYIGLILSLLTGFFFILRISSSFTLAEKIGLSFPVGIALETILMIIADQLGISLTSTLLLSVQVLLLVALLVALYIKDKTFFKPNISFKLSLRGFNLVWLLIVALIVYMEYMNFSKCMFFPPSDRDSLAGFETIGYVAGQEHTFKGLSLFDKDYIPSISAPGSYITYAPLVQLAYAYVYTLGAETSKVIPALIFMFFLIAFYGATKRVTTPTGAAIATLFMLITPEMLAFSSLSMTNIIHAAYASLGCIYLAIWFKYRERKDLLLSGILLGLNMWCRTEGIVFIVAACLVLLIDVIRTKRYKAHALCVGLMIIPPLLWVVFLKLNGLSAESIAITKPFWDAEKLGIIKEYMTSLYTNNLYYGWSFYAFILMALANCWFIWKKRDNLPILTLIVTASIAYMVVLYQIDYKWDTIQNVLSYSAKRFQFCFIPLLWYYSLTNHLVKLSLTKLDKLISLRQE